MNKDRRKRVTKAVEHLRNASSILESVCDEESQALENRPESFSETDEYIESEEAVDTMSDAVNDLEQIVENLGNIC